MDTTRRPALGPAAVAVTALLAAAGLVVAGLSPRGDLVFYVSTVLVAIVYGISWWLIGAPRETFRADTAARDALRGAIWGVGLIVVFVLGALVVRQIPLLAGPVDSLLAHSSSGNLIPVLGVTALNGVAEELFYRRTAPLNLPGSGRVRWLTSLVLYACVSLALGVVLLALAAMMLGLAATYEARKRSSLTSPIVMHVVWSAGMLFVLPPLIGA